MGKELTYQCVTSARWDLDKGLVEDLTTFSHSVNYTDLKEAIVSIIFKKFFKKIDLSLDRKKFLLDIKKQLEKMIVMYDLVDILSETLEDDLKEYFEEEAFEEWEG